MPSLAILLFNKTNLNHVKHMCVLWVESIMRKTACIVVIALMLVLPQAFVRGELYEWPQLGKNAMREGIADVMPELDLDIVWKTSIKSTEDDKIMNIEASPISDGERVFITAYDELNSRGRIVTVDRLTGKEQTFLSSNAPFIGTPIIFDDYLYAASAHMCIGKTLMDNRTNQS